MLETVSVDGVRRALRELWAAEADGDNVLRAQTHNLIVYTEGDAAELNQTVERLIAITTERPGRVILIHAQPGEDDFLEAGITSFCKPFSGRQLCGELITFTVGGPSRDELHSTVLSLLAPSLPVYLWWDEPLRDADHLFDHLLPEADRLLLDSSEYADAAAALSRLEPYTPRELGDLNWARLTIWRRLLARLWDLPDLAEPLQHIESLDVHYISPGSMAFAAQPLLIVGWFASRLEWELVSAEYGEAGGLLTRWHDGGMPAQHTKVEIVGSHDDRLETGTLSGVFLQAGEQPPYAMPRVQRIAEDACIELRRDEDSPHSGQQFRFEGVGLGAALAEELDFGYDPAYTDALKAVFTILERLQ